VRVNIKIKLIPKINKNMANQNQTKENPNKKVNLIVRSNIRKALKGKIANVAEEVEEMLNEKVHKFLDTAVERAKSNQRKTLHARDL